MAFLLFFAGQAEAQLSPGVLSKVHAHLEGLNNCSKCHVMGEKETTSKCLECHKEIKNLISQGKGYHASTEVKGKKCAGCHGEHYGLDFKIIKFNEKSFNHNLSGYNLEGKHNLIKCSDCHKPQFIRLKISQKSSGSWLGLEPKCVGCHDDYHQNTLSSDCKSCHTNESFKPAPKFNHSSTKYPLIGKHQSVTCESCHKTEILNGKRFQRFSGVAFASCTNCHVDVHQNKFGSDCRKCHNEFSFHEVKSLGNFDHEKTNFPLRGSHQIVDCKKCHTKSLTTPLKHDRCDNCHPDYHQKQFAQNGTSPDCAVCHSVERFSPSLFSIEKHNKSLFPLEDSHQATPCFSCHKKTGSWNFRNIGKQCLDCHPNIHKGYLDEKYFPEGNCKTCHSVTHWGEIKFDHSHTSFALSGQHAKTSCKSCHFSVKDEIKTQQFAGTGGKCEKCHTDIHLKQFEDQGINDCERCHSFNNWKAEKFDHNTARFKLDGKHEKVACSKCHKPKNEPNRSYVIYKFKDISCASCH